MKSYYIPLAEIPLPQLKSVFRQPMLCLFTKNLNGKKCNAQSTMEEIPLWFLVEIQTGTAILKDNMAI